MGMGDEERRSEVHPGDLFSKPNQGRNDPKASERKGGDRLRASQAASGAEDGLWRELCAEESPIRSV